MWRKGLLSYWPTLVVHKQRIFTASINLRRSSKRQQDPYASVFKDDMLNFTPDELQHEITFMANMPMSGVLARQESAEIDIEEKRKFRRRKNEIRKIERYFPKEPETCFLTWDMKEQLKGLYSKDPHLWTPKELSYIFPASEPEIKLLLRDRKRFSEDKIKAHDKEVLENWKKYSKGQFGSVALLKKTIEKRLLEVSKTTLPAITMGNDREVTSFLESLKFSEEDDEPVHHDIDRKKHLEKIYRKKYPFKETFKQIMTKYNDDLKDLENSQDSSTGKELAPMQSLSEVLPEYKEDVDDSYVQVQSDVGNERLISSQNVKKSGNVSYDDFVKLKSNSKSENLEVPDVRDVGERRKAISEFKKLSFSESEPPLEQTELLMKELSEVGDISGLETIGNSLSEQMRKKVNFAMKLALAYRQNGETEDFLKRVLDHAVGDFEDALVGYIPFSVIYSIVKEEPNLRPLVRKYAEEAAKKGHLRLIAALMNSYLAMKKNDEAVDIYSKYFATEERVPIDLACKLGYRYNDYTILNSILQLVNRHPEGREETKFYIYSTLLDLLIKEQRIDEAIGVIEDLSSQNMRGGRLRVSTLKKLKEEMIKRGLPLNENVEKMFQIRSSFAGSVNWREGAPVDAPSPQRSI